jgi:phage baseplate assembly protein W
VLKFDTDLFSGCVLGVTVRKDFLGRGWKFAFGFDPASGGVSMSEHEENIRQSVTIILGTQPGERQMLPDFGCRIHELMFAPATRATATMAQYHVETALARWEPRIDVINVDSYPGSSGVLRVEVKYRIKSTLADQTLDLQLTSGG